MGDGWSIRLSRDNSMHGSRYYYGEPVLVPGIYGVPESQSAETDQIPRAFQLHADVQQYNQLINMHKIRHSDLRVRTERPSMLDLGECHLCCLISQMLTIQSFIDLSQR